MTAWRAAATVERVRRITPLAPADETGTAASVTVVVPARNEASRIGPCVAALRGQTGATLRLLVVDDDSTDGTEGVARRAAGADPRVRVVRGTGPPPGWNGKVAALQAGLDADAGGPAPEWLLFVDADTLLAPDVLVRLVATARRTGADLVSAAGTAPPGGSIAWPLLMPTGIVFIGEHADPDGRGRRAFAIGQCLLVRRTALERAGGWAALRDRRTEDVLLATRVRDSGGRTRLVDAGGLVTTTGLDPFRAGWGSFRKTLVAATGRSVPVLAGGGLGQMLLSLAPPAAVVLGMCRRRPWPVLTGGLGWVAAAVAHDRTGRLMRVHRAPAALAVLAPLAGAVFGAVLADGARVVLRGRAGWKGRDQ
ncbi:hypothetical protein AFB00_26080 [Pseudonocardia sp. HH130630-07]|nr:hypothetical protein AFB00_26080 [Pseudonocardia sp. HH130630-07]